MSVPACISLTCLLLVIILMFASCETDSPLQSNVSPPDRPDMTYRSLVLPSALVASDDSMANKLVDYIDLCNSIYDLDEFYYPPMSVEFPNSVVPSLNDSMWIWKEYWVVQGIQDESINVDIHKETYARKGAFYWIIRVTFMLSFFQSWEDRRYIESALYPDEDKGYLVVYDIHRGSRRRYWAWQNREHGTELECMILDPEREIHLDIEVDLQDNSAGHMNVFRIQGYEYQPLYEFEWSASGSGSWMQFLTSDTTEYKSGPF